MKLQISQFYPLLSNRNLVKSTRPKHQQFSVPGTESFLSAFCSFHEYPTTHFPGIYFLSTLILLLKILCFPNFSLLRH